MENISQKKRKALLEKLDELRKKSTNETEKKVFNEIENELISLKYGLNWEKHEEQVNIDLETKIPVFLERQEKELKKHEGEFNFLIEGDNLCSLILLEKTHKGKIDVIYIDPPYNTGQEFIYDDDYKDEKDLFSHSLWLSFMYERLKIAEKLLSKQGVIFISINDKEFAQLKLLCDQIFGKDNFYSTLLWKSRTKSTNSGKARKQIQQSMEYILVYGKETKEKFDGFELLYKEDKKKYPHNGIHGKCRFENLESTDIGRKKRDTMKFPILGVLPRENKRWQIGELTAKNLIADGKIELVDGIPKRAYYPEDEEDSFIPFWSLITECGTAESGKFHLSSILGENHGFDTVKPVELIELILSRTKKDAIVLDFFAGSGTTGEAVLSCNKKDGGTRKFILCTDNSVSKKTRSWLEKNGFTPNDPEWRNEGICEKITYPRLKSVINGYLSQKKQKEILFSVKITPSNLKKYPIWLEEIQKIINKNEFEKYETKVENSLLILYGKTNVEENVFGFPANLKYYQTSYIEKENEDSLLRDELLKHIKEMIQLENHTSINQGIDFILLNENQAKTLLDDIDKGICQRIYKDSNIFLDQEIIHHLKRLNIKIIDIPNYYFAKELKEAGEL